MLHFQGLYDFRRDFPPFLNDCKTIENSGQTGFLGISDDSSQIVVTVISLVFWLQLVSTQIAESTPGPVAINSATYIGYKIAGFAGAAMSTLAVCIPSFFVIYGISLFFDQFLSLRWVSCAFRGIQVCVIYLILTAGLKMLKSIDKNTLNLTLLTLVMASMLCCSITAVSFSSVFYILICGAVGLVVFFLRKIRKGHGKTS